MDDKTLQALTALATELGTTSEYLFGVLVKQAPISGTINLLVMAAWAYACVVLVRITKRKTTKKEGAHYAEWDSVVWIATGGVVLVVALIVGCELAGAISAIVNPEYWALKQIFN
jgi:uncharacterized membrane protein